MKTASVIASLGALSRKWLTPNFRFRRMAVRKLVQKSGFAPRQAETLLDALFAELTAPKLRLLLRTEVGDPRLLDGPLQGPRRMTHVLAGNVPNPGVQSLVHGLLVKSFNAVKCSSRDEGILDLYIGSLRAHDRVLAGFCRLLDPRDRAELRRSIASSDLVIAYGSNESIAAVRAMAGARKACVGYGNRISFSLYTWAATHVGARRAVPLLARQTALDVWMMDRRGCLSPMLIFVEESPLNNTFYKEVLRAMNRLEAGEGIRRLDWARASAIRSVAHEAKLKKTLYFGTTPMGRYFVRGEKLRDLCWGDAPGVDIRVFRRIDEVYRVLTPLAKSLQAVALECAASERPRIEKKLSRLGVNRVCRAGRLQFPPVTWPHDGRPNLAGWLSRTDKG